MNETLLGTMANADMFDNVYSYKLAGFNVNAHRPPHHKQLNSLEKFGKKLRKMIKVKTRKEAATEFLIRICQEEPTFEPEKEESIKAAVEELETRWNSDEEVSEPYYKQISLRASTVRKSAAKPSLLQQPSFAAIDTTVVLTFPGGFVSLFSITPLILTKIKAKKQKQNPFEKMLTLPDLKNLRKKTESYITFLEPQYTLQQSALQLYNPLYLDHPDLTSGKHKTVITLPSYLGSIILPSTAQEMKRHLNMQFKETHPGVDASITLSSIRSLKATLCKIGGLLDMEISSVAVAIVYLEKLILKGYVNKQNKRLIAAICLLLAAKVNDTKEFGNFPLIQACERVMEIPIKDIYTQEFAVYAALEFTLFIAPCEVLPHLQRINKVFFQNGSRLSVSGKLIN